MSGAICGNMIGGAAPLRTLILEDENGNQLAGVVVGQEVIFTATDNDVRVGSVYAGDNGVSTGTKVIPAYYTSEGYKIITAGSKFTLELSACDAYDYTKLQCIICPFNKSAVNSVAAEKVAIENNVYEVNSTTSLSTVIKNPTNKVVDLGITNETSTPYMIRYFTYKEIE